MKNKNKHHNNSKNAIKEVNVDSLLNDMRREPAGDLSKVSLGSVQPISKLLSGDSKASHSRELGSPHQMTAGNTSSVRSNDVPAIPSVPDSANDHISRSKKQKLRLLRKLNERGGFVDDASSEQSIERQVTGDDPSRIRKQKRNYVERASSLTGGAASKCSWKDYACVFFVLLAILAAGLLRVQEEVFGTVEHLRQESDADYYEILGIPHAATLRDIKKAYREKVLEIHPDHHPDCVDCQERFIASTKAYNTLVNADQRKVYDESRGSYDPILSDFSVSLTWFNYDKLVADSSSVWVIQVYDDLDSYSKYFAQQWDGVAGSDLAELGGIKFGRVNARRDRDLLSRLPMRTRTYPTVMLFTRDTMPSIFSLADTSTKALRKWVIAETPSFFAQPNPSNAYKLVITTPDPPSLKFKSASAKFARVFDFEWKAGTPSVIAVVNKNSDAQIASVSISSDVFGVIDTLKQRLLVPVTRHSIADVCDGPVHCVFDSMDKQELLKAPMISEDEMQIQRISVSGQSKSFIIDFSSSRISFDVNNGFDPNFSPIHRNEFVDQILPKSLMDTVRDHSRLLLIAGLLAGAGVVLTRVGPVQITAGVLAMSMLVGLLNQPIFAQMLARAMAGLR